MKGDESKESAAKLLLGGVVDSLLDYPELGFSNALQSGALQLSVDAEGWAVLTCNGQGREGHGDLSFVYRPRGFVTKLYEEAEKKFDELTAKCHYSNEDTVKQVLLRENVTAEYRKQAVRDAVRVGVLTALAQLMLTMGRTLTGQYRDSLTVAVAALEMTSVQSFEGQTYEENGDKVTVLEVERRVKALVEDRVNDVSDEKREYLAALFSNIPALRVPTGGPGRPLGSGKSGGDRLQEKREFEQKIESAIRKLLSTSGGIPIKTKVAQELNIGGPSPRTGNDTSLNAFNNKLGRLGVDYDAIIKKMGLNK